MTVKKTTISTAIAIALGCSSFTVSAALTSSATLDFTLGEFEAIGDGEFDILTGSYFGFDANGSGSIESGEKIGTGSFNGIHIGTAQAASGSHNGTINGSETPNIDNPWMFLGNVGMHQTTSPVTVNGGSGDNLTLDMSGWGFTWNGIESISMLQQGTANISCSIGSSCSDSSNYTLDAEFHADSSGFTTVPYALHLEGHVMGYTIPAEVPVPAAVWLFGSGLLGLAGIARRKKA